MSERYVRLFSLPEKQYTPDAPLLILAGALLKDNLTGKVLAQFKFKNISEKKIASVRISVSAFDSFGNQLPNITEYQYSNLSVSPYDEFGQTQAVPLSDAVTCAISVVCTQVVFSDQSSWNQTETIAWKKMPEAAYIKLLQKEQAQYSKKYQRYPIYCLFLCGLGVALIIIALLRALAVRYIPFSRFFNSFSFSSMLYYCNPIAFIIPILYVITMKSNWTSKAIKKLEYAALTAVALQLLSNIIVLRLSGYDSTLFSYVDGSGFLCKLLRASYDYPFYFYRKYAYNSFGHNDSFHHCLLLLSDICFIGKNILCVWSLRNLSRKMKH